MAKWTPISLTGGCVNTREESGLEPGELVSSSRARLKPNDLGQLHRDKGPSTLANTTTLSDIDYISWEESANQILALRNPSNSQLWLINAVTGAVGNAEALSSTVPNVAAVHRGNEYFVGTSEANHVLFDGGGQGEFRDMGMEESDLTSASPLVVVLSSEFSPAPTPPTSWEVGDVIMYWLTEYDSTNDVESGPVYVWIWSTKALATAYSDGDAPIIPLSTIWSIGANNTNTDRARLYRAYLGDKGSALDSIAAAVEIQRKIRANGSPEFTLTLAGRGGRLDEFDWGETVFDTASKYTDGVDNNDLGKLDPSIQWPQIYINTGSVAVLTDKLVKPQPFDVGILWNDSVVVNDPGTSKQILRFSPPGQPEIQPEPYFIYFATKSSDEIIGLEQLNGRLLVLMTGSIWRVNYLPYEGFVASATGKIQNSVNENEGCVGRSAYRVVETESGEVLVWLSPEGLRATNGNGWTDICPDWSVEGAGISGLSGAILHDNRRLYRLELYLGTTRYDFYYHPSLLKEGKFRFFGPTTVSLSVLASTGGELSGVSESWIASATSVLRQNQADDESEITLQTGQIHPPNPMQALEVNEAALTHSASAGSATITVTTKETGEDESSENTSVALTKDETTPNSFAGGGNAGNWIQFSLTAPSSGNHSFGPLWAQIDLLEDGDG